jgi:hypothetical protein
MAMSLKEDRTKRSTGVVAKKPASGWSDGLPLVQETPETVSRFLGESGFDADATLARGVSVHDVAVQAVRAGCLPDYMPVIVAAMEAVLDDAFHMEHMAGPLATWPGFVVNGPVTAKIGLYNGPYVLSSGRRANATVGRAISLALANCVPQLAGAGFSVLGSATRMAGLVIAEREDTAWDPLHVTLGHKPEESVVTAFSTFQGSPAQLLPLSSWYTSGETVGALIAEIVAEGWCCPGTHMLMVSPNAQRLFVGDGWSKDDLRRYLVENTRISVAQLKRISRWKASDPAVPSDEEHFLRLADDELWDRLTLAPGQAEVLRGFDVLPFVSGSEVAHMYCHVFYPYPTVSPRPVSKPVRMG